MLKRIGLLISDIDGGSEYDFWKMAPKGLAIHTARISKIANLKDELYKEASKLESLVDIFVYQEDYEVHNISSDIRQVLEQFEKPYVLAEESALELFKELGISKIWLFTPYTVERALEEVEYLTVNGISVTGYTYLNINDKIGLKNVDYKTISIALLKSRVSKDSEAIYIYGSNLITYKAVKTLPRVFGIPVISTNLASLFMALRKIKYVKNGFDSLTLI
ncbi:arylmalonate decarboxylase [Sulfurisphaera javensis]|uniref:Arylmalonate decarboxylase n=1 Tax=Sulfurisphaera javensis TaxID=2049879 RepID=A0AAT9GT74_9CREN